MKSLYCLEECGTKKLLNISGRGSENGDKVILFGESGEANEKWYVYQSGAIMSYSAKNKALTYIPETNKLVIWDYNSKDLRQHFTFKSRKAGRELIISKYNGKVMSSIPPRHTNVSFNMFVPGKSGQYFRRVKTLPTLMTDTMGGVINWAVRFGKGSTVRSREEESYGRWYRLRNKRSGNFVSVIGEHEDKIGMINDKHPNFQNPTSWWFFHEHHICNAKFRRHCIGYSDQRTSSGEFQISLCEFNGSDSSQVWKLIDRQLFQNGKDQKVLHQEQSKLVAFEKQKKRTTQFYKLQSWRLDGEKEFPSRYYEPIQRNPHSPASSTPLTPIDPENLIPSVSTNNKTSKGKETMDEGFVMVGEEEWSINTGLAESDEVEEINASEVMTSVELNELIGSLNNAKYTTEKERILREIAGKDYIRCDQLDKIFGTLMFVQDKLWAVRLFRNRIVDRKNAGLLTKHFDFEDEQKEIMNVIAKRSKRIK